MSPHAPAPRPEACKQLRGRDCPRRPRILSLRFRPEESGTRWPHLTHTVQVIVTLQTDTAPPTSSQSSGVGGKGVRIREASAAVAVRWLVGGNERAGHRWPCARSRVGTSEPVADRGLAQRTEPPLAAQRTALPRAFRGRGGALCPGLAGRRGRVRQAGWLPGPQHRWLVRLLRPVSERTQSPAPATGRGGRPSRPHGFPSAGRYHGQLSSPLTCANPTRVDFCANPTGVDFCAIFFFFSL